MAAVSPLRFALVFGNGFCPVYSNRTDFTSGAFAFAYFVPVFHIFSTNLFRKGGGKVKGLPEERAVRAAEYIVETKATVRAAAKRFGVSKSTVQRCIIKKSVLSGLSDNGFVMRLSAESFYIKFSN